MSDVADSLESLAALRPDPLPLVSVIVAHFEQQSQLDRTLLAVDRQDYPREFLDVIVVDDGSRLAPRVPPHVRLLRQEDHGFRLAAARNLGAAAARGSVLCFLDADTAPEPPYVRELTRLPALAADAVTVGLRRHADFDAVGAGDRVEEVGPLRELPTPRWLTLAYERSRNLRDSDHRSYRYLIGAVLACGRHFFEEVGGFDESFSSYGGEDWEWGYRAWLAGADFAHVPTAVAWHDGPDWSGRSVADNRRAKNGETLRLMDAIPTSGSRGRGVRSASVDVVVEIVASGSAAALFVCVDSVLEGLPHALVVVPAGVHDFAGDVRVQSSFDPAHHPLVRVTVSISEPVRVDPEALQTVVETVASGAGAGADLIARDGTGRAFIEIRSTRARRRRSRADRDDAVPTDEAEVDWIHPLQGEPDLEAYLGGWG